MTARVRLFAALRDAAGTGATTVDASTVAEVLDGLRARYGSEFGRWLDVSSVLVDGRPADPAERVEPDAEIVLLPPFSGG